MSRSTAKNVHKIRGPLYGTHNRMMRRINKQRVANGERPFSMREKVNDWDIVDWISILPGRKKK